MNKTEEENFTGEELPIWALVVFGLLHSLTSVNGVVGSVLILTALTTNKHFRTSTNCTYAVYMGNLVVTDLYFQIYFFPMLAVGFALGRYPMVNSAHCVVTGYTAMCCYSVFILTLTAISFDRYIRVCHDNLHRQYFSWKTSLAVCAIIWILGAMVPLTGALKNSLGFDTKTWVCFTKHSADASVSLPYLMCFVFTMLASTFFNLRIYMVYRATRRRIEQHAQAGQDTEAFPRQKTVSSSDLALLRSLLVIILCLVIFVTPGSVARGLRSKVDIDNVLYAFFLWLLSLNSSIDWIVYGLLNTRFRIGYRNILSKCNLPPCGTESVTTSIATTQQ